MNRAQGRGEEGITLGIVHNGRGREDRSEEWREDRSEGWREEGITVGIVHHVCMLLSLHTPHLYYWVTVELNSFVVPLWKQTVGCIMQFVDK